MSLRDLSDIGLGCTPEPQTKNWQKMLICTGPASSSAAWTFATTCMFLWIRFAGSVLSQIDVTVLPRSLTWHVVWRYVEGADMSVIS